MTCIIKSVGCRVKSIIVYLYIEYVIWSINSYYNVLIFFLLINRIFAKNCTLVTSYYKNRSCITVIINCKFILTILILNSISNYRLCIINCDRSLKEHSWSIKCRNILNIIIVCWNSLNTNLYLCSIWKLLAIHICTVPVKLSRINRISPLALTLNIECCILSAFHLLVIFLTCISISNSCDKTTSVSNKCEILASKY